MPHTQSLFTPEGQANFNGHIASFPFSITYEKVIVFLGALLKANVPCRF